MICHTSDRGRINLPFSSDIAPVELLELLPREGHGTERAVKLYSGPLFDTSSVEVMALIAWQRSHMVELFVVLEADATLDVLFETCAIHGARQVLEGQAHRSLRGTGPRSTHDRLHFRCGLTILVCSHGTVGNNNRFLRRQLLT